jgi:glutamate racemase
MSADLSVHKVASERVAFKAGGKATLPKPEPDHPVGIFDSGVGGLSVFSEFIRQLPHEDVIYFADTARVPYGGRSAEEIISINEEIMRYFSAREVKLVIMACGTSSSLAYPVIKDRFPVPMVAMIGPGARAAAAATRNGKVGVIATIGTVNSGAFQAAVKEIKKDAEVHAVACPLFVPLIEGGFIEAEETKKAAREYLRRLIGAGIDTLILGCTHYPHLKKIIGEICGPGITLVDPAEEVVHDAREILARCGMAKGHGSPAKYEYIVTGEPHQFQDLGSRLLGRTIPEVKQVKL